MPKILTQSQIDTFWRDGCVFPIRVMPNAQALEIRARLEAFERKTGGPLKGDLRHKAHLLFPWLNDIVRNSNIVDAIRKPLVSDRVHRIHRPQSVNRSASTSYVDANRLSTFCAKAWPAARPSTFEN